MAVGHRPHPADPLIKPPPASGGKQILGAAPVPQIQEQIVDKMVDVLVILQLKYQQCLPMDSVMVHQIQFIDRLSDFQLRHRDRCAQCKLYSFQWSTLL